MTHTPRGQCGFITFERFFVNIKHATHTTFTAALGRIRLNRPDWRRIRRVDGIDVHRDQAFLSCGRFQHIAIHPIVGSS